MSGRFLGLTSFIPVHVVVCCRLRQLCAFHVHLCSERVLSTISLSLTTFFILLWNADMVD